MTNQLLEEADALPELDEFSGLSIVDIAHAIINWPEGSEDQARAIAAIRARAPGIGHNRPPLAERLDDDLSALKGRADAMLELAAKSVIVDDESAAKVLDLANMMRAAEEELEKKRRELCAPYTEAANLINARLRALAEPLSVARQGADRKGGLRAMLTAFDDKKEAEAEAARKAAQEQQRKLEAEAAAKREAAEQQKETGGNSVPAELDALRAEDEADRAAMRANAIRPEPIRSNTGQISRSREIKFDINGLDGLRKALGWILKQTGGQGAAQQFASTYIGRHLRALGVDNVEKGVAIPGVTVSIVKGQANARR